ncbi:MAG TPA: high-affinity nickel-transporter, partial [Anaerolineae bacterium]|nr:high-affinity nickel-transporter [Anaerolineae bacterium]
MKRVRFVTLILLLITATPFFVSTAAAHPLGNFTINHYAGLDVQPEAIVIDYLLDMAEIPTFQEIAALDANGNGRADPEETAPYHVAQCHRLQTELVLRLNGRPEPLTGESSALEFLPGAGGLPTLRLNCT